MRWGFWGNVLARTTAALKRSRASHEADRVEFVAPLCGHEAQWYSEKACAAAAAFGGVRQYSDSVPRLPQVQQAGQPVRRALGAELDEVPGIEASCVAAIGTKQEHAGLSEEHLALARQAMGNMLGTDDVEPLSVDHNCRICGKLLDAWMKFAKDPDTEAASWTWTSAPAGILHHPRQLGVFPEATEHDVIAEPETAMFDDPIAMFSYASAHCGDFAFEAVERRAKLGYLEVADSVTALGGRVPVVSKPGMIVKTRFGKTERRLILDSKESNLTQCAHKNQRIIVPSVIDLITDINRGRSSPTDVAQDSAVNDIEWLVLDVSDAFWTLGLLGAERLLFVGKPTGQFYIYRRLAQGSRLAW